MVKKRRSISLKNQLHAALLQMGMEPHTVELDHDPALQLRAFDPETGETRPAHDDPKYLVWRPKQDHLEKTTGRRGTSKLSKRGGDVSEIASVKRQEKKHKAFRERLLAKGNEEDAPQETPKRKSKIPSRPFASAKRSLRSK